MMQPAGTSDAATRLTAAHFSLAALGLMWTLPFLQPYHRFPLTAFYSEWLALVLGLLALTWLTRRAWWREATVPHAVPLLLAFAGLLAVQQALGRVPYGGQVLAAGLYVAWAALLMMLAGGLRRALGLDGVATVLAWFLAVGGVLGAVFALLQHYQISDLPHTLVVQKRTPAVYGNIAQYNHFAHYCTLALASIAFLYAARRLHWAAAAAGAAPLAWVIGLSSSRSAVLFLAALLVLAVAYAWRRAEGGRRLGGCVLLMIAGFALMQWLATVSWMESSGGTETVTQRLAGGEGTSSAINIAHRLRLAREAWEMFLQAPVLGVGWGQFPWHDFSDRALRGGSLYTWPFNHAHNIALHLLAETGLAGLLVVVAAALAWARNIKSEWSLPHWWLFAVLAVMAVHSLVEHPLWFAYFLGIAAVAAGLLAPGGFRLGLQRAGPWLAALLLAAGAVYAGLVADKYRDLEHMLSLKAPEARAFDAAVARAHREPLLRPYAELAIAARMPLDTARVNEKRALNDRVMRFAPIASVSYRQALLAALAGDAPSAERHLERAARVYPDGLATALEIMLHISREHPAEVAPLIKSAITRMAERRAASDRR